MFYICRLGIFVSREKGKTFHDLKVGKFAPFATQSSSAFVAVDCLRIDDDHEGSVASRCVISPDHLSFDNDMVRRAPFKKFNDDAAVRRTQSRVVGPIEVSGVSIEPGSGRSLLGVGAYNSTRVYAN